VVSGRASETKLKAQSSKELPKTKLQVPTRAVNDPYWNLQLGASFEL
jgi:hypothetical protein